MNNLEAIQTLRRNLGNLSPRDVNFVDSLLAQHQSRGSLSPKQWHWVHKIAEQSTQPKAAEPARVELGDVSAIVSLFDVAKRRIKTPGVVIIVPGVGEVRVSVASSRAKVPGSLTIADGAYGGNFYGRVLMSGEFEPSGKCAVPDTLIPALKGFAAEPAKVAAEYGRLTARCCFCGDHLEHGNSTAVGYGPTCAKNWNLPYGVRVARAARADLFAEATNEERAMQRMEAEGDRADTIRDERNKHERRDAMKNSGRWLERAV